MHTSAKYPSVPDRLEIAIVAGMRFDTREPHAGGMERHTHVLADQLSRSGHEVTVFAGTGTGLQTDSYRLEPLAEATLDLSDLARADVSMPPEAFMLEHDAYLNLWTRLNDSRFDVVHNNSLHYLPVLSDRQQPTVHTLHTPPTPWLESAYRIRGTRAHRGVVVSVSHDNAARWGGLVDRVIHNGVALDTWRVGDGGGGYALWSGRLVPEKGAHLAIAAARAAGVGLVIAGPRFDAEYFERHIEPELGEDYIYVGHLAADELSHRLRDAAVALVTPRWDEPFGLVVAEALACGTPIAAFGRGAIPELLTDAVGACAEPDDVDGLAAAIGVAMRCRREHCRALAERRFSATEMARQYESTYRSLLAPGRAA